jgi:hypothetical protein
MNRIALIIILYTLTACSQSPSAIRITNDQVPAQVQAKPRSEPVFYNGKTYQLDFAPDAGGGYVMSVSGMSAKQEKDAVAITTSSLRYFACKDSQTSKLLTKPTYIESKWNLTAHCV